MPKRVAIIGTGTDVGKTHASVALLTALARSGFAVVGLKPVETGVALHGTSDSRRLATASTIQPTRPPYVFTEPISPHLAAKRAKVVISLEVVSAWVESHRADWIFIETAGGLLSPLGIGVTNLDLIRILRPDIVILVAPDRLGVLHDVYACMLAFKALYTRPTQFGCLLQPTEAPDASAGTNAAELEILGVVPVVASFPRAGPTSPVVLQAAEKALALVCAGDCFT